MRSPLAANGAQARQTKQIFARPEEQLSFELGKAVQELPPLYTRLLAGTISAIVVGAIAWAHFSQVDEVATAPGELIASTQVRPITSIGNGSILAVRVKEGQRILKDQILVERDPEYQKLDVTRLAQSARLIQQDLRRLDAERTGSKSAGTPIQDELLASRLRDFEAKQRAAEAEASRLASFILCLGNFILVISNLIVSACHFGVSAVELVLCLEVVESRYCTVTNESTHTLLALFGKCNVLIDFLA